VGELIVPLAKVKIHSPAGTALRHFRITARREVFPSLFKLATVCLFLLAAQAFATHQPQENSQTKDFIERIDLVGNRRIETGTLRARISSRPGDPYSVERVRRDVQALRNTQFFDDVRLEVEDSPDQANGKIVMFYVMEKPAIGRIEYKGIQSITESDILDALKDEKVGLSVGSQFDRKKLKHAVVVISELLAAHGQQFAMVKPTYEKVSSTNTVSLVFNIDEGPKAQRSTNGS
jgi:outer membrane protein insertion porin family